ncbi:MAG: hypothetical protein HZA25_02670 [Candidatus Niyogibacteria bacterium]|nr:hypothetical protein [Candidatus Niyogibacteria bacterium]
MPPQFIPSRKIIITGTLLTVFIGWLFWVPTTDTFKLKNLALGKKLQSLTTTLGDQSAPDSDNDGLKDWEEVLWHTDPHNPDTDLDGTPDGEEIKLGRSPTVPGPDDLLSNLAALQTAATATTTQNLTQSVAQALMAEYISAKSGGASTKDIAKKVLAQAALPPYEDAVALSDILISSDNSAAAIKSYLNAVGKSAGQNFKKLNDLPAILTAIQTSQDYAQLEQLSADAAAYGTIAADVRALKAPSSLSLIHLDIINTALNAEKSVLEIQKMGDDPLVAVRGWNEFLKANERLSAIIKKVNAVINEKKIVFTAADPGYIFKQYK